MNNGKHKNGQPSDDRLTLGYIRLTRDESLAKNLSAPAQRQDIADYVARAGLPNLRILEEPKAVGGDIPFEKRAVGRELVRLCRSNQVAAIVVRDVDRLTRDLPLWIKLDKLCEEHEVTIHTFSGPLLSASPSDRFATRVRAAAAQLEKEQTGDRNRRAKRQLAHQGRPVGGPPAFGYTSQAWRKHELALLGVSVESARDQAEQEFPKAMSLYVSKAEAKIVRLIFRLYVEKQLGSRMIANKLNELGHRRRSGKPWVASRITRMLANPVYAGFIPYDEERYQKGRGPFAPQNQQTRYEGKHEPIVDEATWRRAQEIKHARTVLAPKRGNASVANRRYPLAGVLVCECGSTMRSGSVQHKGKRGYYVCRRRFHYGPDAVGGCCLPRVSIAKAHAAFWPKLSEIIKAPDLVERLFQAANRIAADRDDAAADDDPQARLKKLAGDIDLWYERHDTADSRVEKDAAWKRILDLKERRRRLEQEVADRPKARRRPTVNETSREDIRRFLDNLASSIPKLRDSGVALVQSLVEHHGLRVLFKEGNRLLIQLLLRPPDSEPSETIEHAVPVEAEAELPLSTVDEWLRQHDGTLVCEYCGEPIQVRRHHFWQGLPKYHHECVLALNVDRRVNPEVGYLNGEQVAKRLTIGRTTLGRWMRSGKLKPDKTVKGIHLFSEERITKFASRRLNPGKFLNARQAGELLGISPRTMTEWIRQGKVKPVRRQGGVWLFDKQTVEKLKDALR